MKKNVLKAIKSKVAFPAEEIPELKIVGNWKSALDVSISPTLL